jgi:hypothetical protein
VITLRGKNAEASSGFAIAEYSGRSTAGERAGGVFGRKISDQKKICAARQPAEWANESRALTREYVYPFPVADINEKMRCGSAASPAAVGTTRFHLVRLLNETLN